MNEKTICNLGPDLEYKVKKFLCFSIIKRLDNPLNFDGFYEVIDDLSKLTSLFDEMFGLSLSLVVNETMKELAEICQQANSQEILQIAEEIASDSGIGETVMLMMHRKISLNEANNFFKILAQNVSCIELSKTHWLVETEDAYKLVCIGEGNVQGGAL